MRARCAALLTLLAVARTAPADAEWVATPYVGLNVSGDVEKGKGGVGGSVAYLGGRVGLELDLQRYQHFFKDGDVANLVPSRRIDLDTDAWSFMGNLVAPIRVGGATRVRPYGAAGVGVVRAMFDSTDDAFDTDQQNLGVNAGGGLMYSLSSRVGVRGDLRYFRVFVDENEREGGYFEDYAFWRATAGVTIGFRR